MSAMFAALCVVPDTELQDGTYLSDGVLISSPEIQAAVEGLVREYGSLLQATYSNVPSDRFIATHAWLLNPMFYAVGQDSVVHGVVEQDESGDYTCMLHQCSAYECECAWRKPLQVSAVIPCR